MIYMREEGEIAGEIYQQEWERKTEGREVEKGGAEERKSEERMLYSHSPLSIILRITKHNLYHRGTQTMRHAERWGWTYRLDLCWPSNFGWGLSLVRGPLRAEHMYTIRSCINSRSLFTHNCFVSSDDAWWSHNTLVRHWSFNQVTVSTPLIYWLTGPRLIFC